MADGHHRSAAAYNIGKLRRDQAKSKGLVTGEEDFNYFMSILYPAEQLQIMDYNRVLKTLNDLTPLDFMREVSQYYDVDEF